MTQTNPNPASVPKAPIDATLAGKRAAPARAPIRPDTRKIDMPVDHQPAAILGEGTSAVRARTAMTVVRDSWTLIKKSAEDSTVDLPRLAKAAQPAFERGLRQCDAAAEDIARHIAGIQKDIAQATQPRVDPMLAAEIRTYWRQQDKPTRAASAAREDVATASALLGAPPYLSGLDEKSRSLVLETAVDAHASEHKAALHEAEVALGKIQAAAARMIEIVGPRLHHWSEPDAGTVKKLEEFGRG